MADTPPAKATTPQLLYVAVLSPCVVTFRELDSGIRPHQLKGPCQSNTQAKKTFLSNSTTRGANLKTMELQQLSDETLVVRVCVL